MHIWISLGTRFRLKLTLEFLDQINTKRRFLKKRKKKKKENYHRILHVRINLSTNLQLKLIHFFGPNLLKNVSCFQSKTDKIHITIEFCIFELVFLSNFTLNKFHFEFLNQIFPRRVFMVEFIEFHMIELVLVPNFSLNWQFCCFGRDLPKKVFPVENRKSEHHYGFYIFELV